MNVFMSLKSHENIMDAASNLSVEEILLSVSTVLDYISLDWKGAERCWELEVFFFHQIQLPLKQAKLSSAKTHEHH